MSELEPTSTQLEPCPFCGGEAQVMHMDLDSIEEGWQVWGVWCVDDLHAEEHGGYQHGHYIDNYDTEAEAIEAWNTRHERTCKCVAEYAQSPFDGKQIVLHRCSACHKLMRPTMPYCPNCGAKVQEMRGDA